MTDLTIGTCAQCGDTFTPPPPGASGRYATYDARAYLCDPCRTAFIAQRTHGYDAARIVNRMACSIDGHKPWTVMSYANFGLPWCSRCRYGLLPEDGTRMPDAEMEVAA